MEIGVEVRALEEVSRCESPIWCFSRYMLWTLLFNPHQTLPQTGSRVSRLVSPIFGSFVSADLFDSSIGNLLLGSRLRGTPSRCPQTPWNTDELTLRQRRLEPKPGPASQEVLEWKPY